MHSLLHSDKSVAFKLLPFKPFEALDTAVLG